MGPGSQSPTAIQPDASHSRPAQRAAQLVLDSDLGWRGRCIRIRPGLHGHRAGLPDGIPVISTDLAVHHSRSDPSTDSHKIVFRVECMRIKNQHRVTERVRLFQVIT